MIFYSIGAVYLSIVHFFERVERKIEKFSIRIISHVILGFVVWPISFAAYFGNQLLDERKSVFLAFMRKDE